jgi:acyl-CoA hydrolase
MELLITEGADAAMPVRRDRPPVRSIVVTGERTQELREDARSPCDLASRVRMNVNSMSSHSKGAKHVSADEAAKLVTSGMWLDYGCCIGQPDVFDKALGVRTRELKGVKIRSCLTMRPRAYHQTDPEGENILSLSWHFTGYDRRQHDAGRCNYLPLNIGEWPESLPPLH